VRAEAAHDPEFGATVKWDAPLLDGYSWTHVPNHGSGADRESLRASWGTAPNDTVFLFCAKLQPWKRPQDLRRAFAK
jgi:hypothetical protein